MTGKRVGFQDNPNDCGTNSSGPTESGRLQSNSWYLPKSPGNDARNPSTSSSLMSSNSEDSQDNVGASPTREQIMFTREVIARESSRTTLYSSSSTAGRKSLLNAVYRIACCMMQPIICLPSFLLRTYVCARDHITMKNCMKALGVLSVAIPLICESFKLKKKTSKHVPIEHQGAAVYCSCLCLKLSDSLSSKELTALYEAELQSLWQSHVLLQEQIHEIESLKKKIDYLGAKISSVNKSVLHSVTQVLEQSDISGENKDHVFEMINLAFRKIYEDHVQMADWAQRTIGATIDKDRTSKSYEPENMQNCWFRSLFMSSAKPPDTILQPDVYPGNCWAFQGSEGQAVIKLPEKIEPTAVTVQHISKVVSPSGGVTSALKDFSVYGLDDETDEETELGSFVYDIEKEAIQTFQLKNEHAKHFLYIKFKIQSNWGNPEFTCIYRVRVHGKMANLVGPSNEGRG